MEKKLLEKVLKYLSRLGGFLCPACSGQRKLSRYSTGPSVDDYEPCFLCEGNGVVPRIGDISVERGLCAAGIPSIWIRWSGYGRPGRPPCEVNHGTNMIYLISAKAGNKKLGKEEYIVDPRVEELIELTPEGPKIEFKEVFKEE